MRLYHLVCTLTFAIAHIVGAALSYCASVVTVPLTYLLKADYGNAWRITTTFCLAAFRSIRELRPVYRESYQTHGLSLSGLAART